MKLLDARALFGFPVLAENVCRALQKLLLPLCNLVRMNLIPLGQLNDRLIALQGIQREFPLNVGA